MARIALLIEYEGTRYHGFQIQIDVPTIQGELERAIVQTTGETVRINGAGRTDAGVHARGQVAAFTTESNLSPGTFSNALNFYLPADIAVRDSLYVSADFDPRRDAVSREYRYIILNSKTRSPLARQWTFMVPEELDFGTMRRACEIIQGEHDFAPFTTSDGASRSTVRNVRAAEITRKADLIIIDIVANAFLRQQVRRIAGSLIQIGSGKMEMNEFVIMARSGKAGVADYAAPPQGLCLMKVNYSSIRFGL
ncbi:MAG: tRNA pseudouridine(38-40) synthase TruA [Dehalococcoidia bacterium]